MIWKSLNLNQRFKVQASTEKTITKRMISLIKMLKNTFMMPKDMNMTTFFKPNRKISFSLKISQEKIQDSKPKTQKNFL
jgi:hypothetical protein